MLTIGNLYLLLFALLNPFSLCFGIVVVGGSIMVAKRIGRRQASFSIAISVMLVWLSSLLTYRILKHMPVGSNSVAGWPIPSFYFPDAQHRIDGVPYSQWIRFYANFFICLVIGSMIGYSLRKSLEKWPKYVFSVLTITAIMISLYGLTTVLAAYEG